MKLDVTPEEWVAALRSGDYAQGQNLLATLVGGTTYYYCLGVLCELIDLPSKSVRDSYSERLRYTYEDINQERYLPTEDGKNYPVSWMTTGLMEKVADMNDGGASFDEIADYLERQLCSAA